MADDLTTTTLRRFNRTYTQRIGVLDDSFLGTGRPLGASRVLYEVGPDGAGVRELRDRLDLDPGYLSRLLARLADDGLLEVVPDEGDRRRRIVALTTAGRRAWADLEARSERLARRLVDPLTPRQRARLVDALAVADLLVRAATVQLRETSPDDPAVRASTARYVAELDSRFPDGFAPDDTAPAGTYLVAVSDGRPVACGAVRSLDEATAEVKRMWVDEAWRGAGLGSRLLRRLEEIAADRGHTHVVLDTHGSLHEAIALYERAGYRRVERYNDNGYAQLFFAKDLDVR